MKIGDYTIVTPPGYQGGGINMAWKLIQIAINLFIFGGIFLALIFLIIGGIKWIASGGDKQALTSAKATVTYSLIGLFLLLFSFTILRIVGSFFGVSLGLP